MEWQTPAGIETLMKTDGAAMVSDRALIGSDLGISRERVREIVKREDRSRPTHPRARGRRLLPPAAESASATATARNMLAKLLGTPNFTPDDIAALEYSVAMFLRSQILD